ncbi:hypothetical protein GCM10018962_50060 [Dactylosporangium matsuzakiense]|uniref:Uncharacterized protein n=2 Tax=Dactylosporangium matsuzakiense TaxID=53360 RepID=A0A9W6NMJ7_9ACTN|nr:hypothetical protein GCM10017581_040330 [Dactylosporangium matsuzakiense]
MVARMEPLPSTDDLLRAMTVLAIPGDPLSIMQDLDADRRRAHLLAHIGAALVERQESLESRAGLSVDDRADLHFAADRAAAGGSGLDRLQAARLAWVQQSVTRQRGRRPDPVADAVATTLGVLVALLTAPPAAGPVVADAVQALCGAADHLGSVLRAQPEPV